MHDLITSFHQSQRRLLLLDYDGTLTDFAPTPPQGAPGTALRTLLRTLAKQPGTTVVLVSGRDQATLDKWFGHLPIGLAAEHGASFKPVHRSWHAVIAPDTSWQPAILGYMQAAASQLPGSLVEHKSFSLAWHYRLCDPQAANNISDQLSSALTPLAKASHLTLLQGHKVLEVKPSTYTKAAAVQYWLKMGKYDFILAAGDDQTDEDLFTALPRSAHSIKVGSGPTAARTTVPTPRALLDLLHQFATAP